MCLLCRVVCVVHVVLVTGWLKNRSLLRKETVIFTLLLTVYLIFKSHCHNKAIHIFYRQGRIYIRSIMLQIIYFNMLARRNLEADCNDFVWFFSIQSRWKFTVVQKMLRQITTSLRVNKVSVFKTLWDGLIAVIMGRVLLSMDSSSAWWNTTFLSGFSHIGDTELCVSRLCEVSVFSLFPIACWNTVMSCLRNYSSNSGKFRWF